MQRFFPTFADGRADGFEARVVPFWEGVPPKTLPLLASWQGVWPLKSMLPTIFSVWLMAVCQGQASGRAPRGLDRLRSAAPTENPDEP